ncbi:MAG: low molecular weight protein-tyrosine-phosphatase [Gemmatimonadota bacterium]|nr:MAG: low molecular weight protein-tyrosine-phosphatase [Gemmatimonadota bacterium]
MVDPPPTSILFVCLGNICRSPLAEAVMRHHLSAAGIEGSVRVDSAGTGAWHEGDSPDPRACAVAERNGVTLNGSARRVVPADFHDFDYVLAMDRTNLRDLEYLQASSGGDAHVALFRHFDPLAEGDSTVPDPYYGGSSGFERIYEMVDRTCRELVECFSVGLRAG